MVNMSSNAKKLKSEQITTTVSSFLKKRKYTETEGLKEIVSEQKLEDMAFKSSVGNERGLQNVLSFGVNTSDPSIYEEQYANLKSFVTGANQAYRIELTKLLFPLFVNIYLELVSKNHLLLAQGFFTKYSTDFSADHKEEIQHLQAITDSERLKSSDIASNFRRSKYVLKLSNKIFTYLLQYLKSGDHLLLLHLLNKCFNIDIAHTKPGQRHGNGDLDTEELDNSGPTHRVREGRHAKAASEKESESLLALKESIGRVRSGPACMPSVCFYSFLNAYQGLCSVALTKDNGMLCGGFEDSSVRVWSLTPKKLVKQKGKTADISKVNLSFDVCQESKKVETISSETQTLRGHCGPVYGTCFTPDGTVLLSASEDTSVRLWNLHSLTNAVLYKGHNYPVWSLDVSPQSWYFVTGSQDRTARLWNIEYTYPLRLFAGHVSDVDVVKFHPNCTYVASGSTDHTCRLWDIQTGKCVRLFTGHKAPVFALAVSPDGQYLASGGEDRCIRLWDLSAGSLLKELRGHTDIIHSMSFSADGTLLASGGLDNCVRVWDMGQALKTSASSSSSGTAVSPELKASYPTKNASVHHVQFSSYNLVSATGAHSA